MPLFFILPFNILCLKVKRSIHVSIIHHLVLNLQNTKFNTVIISKWKKSSITHWFFCGKPYLWSKMENGLCVAIFCFSTYKEFVDYLKTKKNWNTVFITYAHKVWRIPSKLSDWANISFKHMYFIMELITVTNSLSFILLSYLKDISSE